LAIANRSKPLIASFMLSPPYFAKWLGVLNSQPSNILNQSNNKCFFFSKF
jgi:hypothetical protein